MNIKKKSVFKTAGLVLLCLGGAFIFSCSNRNESQSSNAEQSHPNLIIIIADQWRGQALGFLNEDPVKTPNLDSLAEESLVLTNFISNHPVCSPARAMLMSGQYSFTNHVYGNANTATAPYNVELSEETVTWSDVLKENGYSLGYIGKWHLDSPHKPYIPTYNNIGDKKWNEWTPPKRRHGFDYWYAYGTYDKHLHPMYWGPDAGRWDFHFVDEWEPQHDMDKAIEYLENENGKYRKEDQPFGLVVSINPPHSDYKEVPDNYYQEYKDIPFDSLTKDPDIPEDKKKMGEFYRENIKYYYSAVTGDDDQIGRLLRYLGDNKLDENTIVLFISDHGNNLGKHDKISKNNIYEESLRVPFILHWKGHISPRIDDEDLMSYPDIYPTLLDLMGFKKEIPKEVEGESNADYFLGKDKTHPKLQYFMGDIDAPDSTGGMRGVRTKNYKLAYVRKEDSAVQKFLFNHKKDSYELNNLYEQKKKIRDSLKKELIRWLNVTNDPFIENLKD